jgi:hypothetical protein
VKGRRFDPPFKLEVGPLELLVVEARPRRDGTGLVATVQAWNGTIKHADAFEPGDALARRRFSKALVEREPAVTRDDVEAALLEVAATLPGQLAGVEAEPAGPDDGKLSADFPGLVDVVSVGEGGAPGFLVVEEGRLRVVGSWTPGDGPDAGTPLVPPPADALPWVLPRAAEVVGWVERGDDAAALFAEVKSQVRRHVKLPLLGEYPDAYYALSAAWVFHTHRVELAAYSPILACFAVPERGKSRYGRTLIYMGRRGVHTETLREANLFRDAQDRRATLFLDVMDLWKKLERAGAEDVLLLRFERGAKVSRVLYPDRGPFADTVYFDIFGPTIAASNEPIARILDTRCIPIAMPQATAQDGDYPVPDEAALLPVRERLTAWRARVMLSGWRPAPREKPARGRLGDILLPLVQIVAEVAPAELPAFAALAEHLEAERRRDRALSWEGLVAAVLPMVAERVQNGVVLLSEIVEKVNVGREEAEQLKSRRVSNILRSLGFELKKARANKAAVVWDPVKVAAVAAHFAEKSGVEGPGGGSANANHANHANPSGPSGAATVSVVSVVSVAQGGTPPLHTRFSEAEAAPACLLELGQPVYLLGEDGARLTDRPVRIIDREENEIGVLWYGVEGVQEWLPPERLEPAEHDDEEVPF